MTPQKALSYDDVLLYPQQGVVASRSEVDTGTMIGDWHMRLPVFSSPMETVTGLDMALAMAREGCIGVLHRFGTHDDMVEDVEHLRSRGPAMPTAIAIGLRDNRASIDADILVLDAAHADTKDVLLYLEAVRKDYPDKILVGGSVATYNGARRLINAGVDILRVGIGAGAACTTRTVTGFGVPMFTSVQECSSVADSMGKKIIADGGIMNTGDIVKALAAGADYVMMGRMFAGTVQSPMGQAYFGQASSQSAAHGGKYIEGASGYIDDQGTVSDVLQDIDDALRSGISYGGGTDIKTLRERAQFHEVSPLAMAESSVRVESRLVR